MSIRKFFFSQYLSRNDESTISAQKSCLFLNGKSILTFSGIYFLKYQYKDRLQS